MLIEEPPQFLPTHFIPRLHYLVYLHIHDLPGLRVVVHHLAHHGVHVQRDQLHELEQLHVHEHHSLFEVGAVLQLQQILHTHLQLHVLQHDPDPWMQISVQVECELGDGLQVLLVPGDHGERLPRLRVLHREPLEVLHHTLPVLHAQCLVDLLQRRLLGRHLRLRPRRLPLQVQRVEGELRLFQLLFPLSVVVRQFQWRLRFALLITVKYVVLVLVLHLLVHPDDHLQCVLLAAPVLQLAVDHAEVVFAAEVD